LTTSAGYDIINTKHIRPTQAGPSVKGVNHMTVKQQIVRIIEKLPGNVAVSDVIAELYFKEQVDRGLKELDNGKSISHKTAKERLAKWLK